MSHRNLIDSALQRAQAKVAGGGTDSTKTASNSGSLAGEAREVAQALEYLSVKIADDGTPEGDHRVSQIRNFLADKTAGNGPAQSVSPTGTQATPPQAGKKTITPSASGARPAESEAPTGTQTTIGQEPPASQRPPMEGGSKKASLYDLVMQHGDALSEVDKEAGKGGPAESEALENQASPPSKNENTNIEMLRSNTGPVSATKRQAKMPTRARLKQLFANAGDVGPSHAAAKAAFPAAFSRGGGIKEAADKGDGPSWSERQKMVMEATGRPGETGWKKHLAHPDLTKSRLKSGLVGTAIGGAAGAGLGAGAAALSKGKVRPSEGAVLGGGLGAILGDAAGTDHANRKWLGERGIKLKSLGFDADVSGYKGHKKAASAILDAARSGGLGAEAQEFAAFIDGIQV
jgi:hypothetical protein